MKTSQVIASRVKTEFAEKVDKFAREVEKKSPSDLIKIALEYYMNHKSAQNERGT